MRLTCFLVIVSLLVSNLLYAEQSGGIVNSLGELRFGIVDREANGCTMRQVLADFGVAAGNIVEADLSKPLKEINVLVLADGVVGRDDAITSSAKKIQEFVRQGGICWILSQKHNTWTSEWLPERLKSLELTHQYGLRCVGSKAPHYLCPWLIERHHAVFNHPNHLDESNFSFWALTVDNVPCFTSAFSAITSVSGWEVLGRYADPSCADGALILQAPDGKGLYLWTQIFSPQIVWQQPNKRLRQTWEKLLENVLTYFVSLRRGEVCRIESQPRPWSVLAGENVAIETIVESPLTVEKADAEVCSPDGKLTKVTLTAGGKKGSGTFCRNGPKGASHKMYLTPFSLKGNFTPQQRGEHFVRITVCFRGGAVAHDHFAFKVTKGWTVYAVDEVPIHFYIDAGQPAGGIGTVRWTAKTPEDSEFCVIPPEQPRTIHQVEIVRNGKAVKTYAPNTRELEETLADRIGGDAWYCLRAKSFDGHAYTNPVFVKRIDGPPGAWLWSRGEIAGVTCDRQAKQWRVELTGGGAIRFCIPARQATCTVDGKPADCRLDPRSSIGELKAPDGAKKVVISW